MPGCGCGHTCLESFGVSIERAPSLCLFLFVNQLRHIWTMEIFLNPLLISLLSVYLVNTRPFQLTRERQQKSKGMASHSLQEYILFTQFCLDREDLLQPSYILWLVFAGPWSVPGPVSEVAYHLNTYFCINIRGASKSNWKKVNKKRTVTDRRVIIFLNISRHPLLICLQCCLHHYKTLKAVATETAAIVLFVQEPY